MARHPRAIAWEEKLKEVFDVIDHELEDEYGDRYNLHPTRPSRGQTANPESDGLFNIGASFTAGYGSEHGRGYVINVRMVTLDQVSPDFQEKMEDEVVAKLRERLPAHFPGRDLRVERDGHVFKITGDLSL
ncbi:MAG TPA: hypothetical protein PJ991_07920 [Kiritimatiellia bacterium]|nr:hypothetical protein [Kiritimatiellia bacterium]